MGAPVVIAIAAHPDDIEFNMAGTLLLLKQAGYETHYLNLASGNCGSADRTSDATRLLRAKEAQAAASVLGAHFHHCLTDDLEIFYEPGLLGRLSAILREVRPAIVLTHSPEDYMEDHVNTSRLTVTAAFARGMPNFKTSPRRSAVQCDVALYHCLPHGLRDSLRRRIIPGAFVNTTAVHKTKREALAKHQSQQSWLDVSQGLNSYLQAMEEMSVAIGRMSRRFNHSEGWRRHSHLGFSTTEIDPLRRALGRDYWVNARYERSLEKGV